MMMLMLTTMTITEGGNEGSALQDEGGELLHRDGEAGQTLFYPPHREGVTATRKEKF